MACLCESCGNITFCLDDSLTQIKILVCVNQALDSYIYENRVYENMFLRLDFFLSSAKSLRDIRLETIGLVVEQLCVLGNLCPETAEEAVAMVPSLKVN